MFTSIARSCCLYIGYFLKMFILSMDAGLFIVTLDV